MESHIHTHAAEFDNHIYQMELQRYELQKELQNVGDSRAIIVRALANGRVDSLSYRYDSHSPSIFSALDIAVAGGESVAIVGPSCAGKPH